MIKAPIDLTESALSQGRDYFVSISNMLSDLYQVFFLVVIKPVVRPFPGMDPSFAQILGKEEYCLKFVNLLLFIIREELAKVL